MFTRARVTRFTLPNTAERATATEPMQDVSLWTKKTPRISDSRICLSRKIGWRGWSIFRWFLFHFSIFFIFPFFSFFLSFSHFFPFPISLFFAYSEARTRHPDPSFEYRWPPSHVLANLVNYLKRRIRWSCALEQNFPESEALKDTSGICFCAHARNPKNQQIFAHTKSRVLFFGNFGANTQKWAFLQKISDFEVDPTVSPKNLPNRFDKDSQQHLSLCFVKRVFVQ